MESVIAFIVGVLVVVVGLLLSIGLHELGHLFWAKRFGVKVGQWMIGFGPTLVSKKLGETEYGIKAIPLGGYISMAGMYPPTAEEKREAVEEREGRRSAAREEAAGANAAAEEREGGGRRAASRAHGRASTTGFFNAVVQDAPADADMRRLEREDDRVFYKLAPWKRIIIMLGGPVMNLLIGLVCATIVLCGFGMAQATTTIGSISKCVVPQTESTRSTSCAGRDPSPAAAAKLEPGDRLVSIDGTRVTSWDQATGIIRSSPEKTLTVVVDRKGAETTLTVTPITNTVAVTDQYGAPVKDASGAYVTKKVGFIGIGTTDETVQQPITAVVPYVWYNVTSVGNIILHYPQRIVAVVQAAFGGGQRDPNGPISVVGVGRIAGEAATSNAPIANRVVFLVNLIGSVNIALFVFNLVPLLPLDGGHVIGALWESIRRRFAKLIRRPDPGPVDISKLIPLTMVVTVILGATSLLLIYADIVNPVKLF